MPYADRQRQRAAVREAVQRHRDRQRRQKGITGEGVIPLERRGVIPPGVVPYHRPPEEQRHSLTTRRQDQDAPSRAWIAELAEQRAMLAAVIECLRLLAGHDRAKLFIIEEYLAGPELPAAGIYTQRPTHHDIAAVT